ncbi:SDR family oxidoreductase [Actinocorallia longicatena]|uniref:SDR family oxidoreductase n=1 Tax=Actinocorallia longicatena TaxID=111803 RepID=A0ABP6QMU4_9ACTN
MERVVIIGGTSGIGLATAARLARTGREVVITGRDEARLEGALKELGAGVSGRAADARDAGAMRALFAGLGSVDHVVITVTGRQGVGPLAELTPETLREAVENKLVAQVLAAQAALPVLAGNGSLTFVSASSAGAAYPGVAGVAAVNGAIEAMVPGLAVELAPRRVNAVSPGVIDTPWWDWLGEEARPAVLDSFAASTAVGRVGLPDDVARAIEYLVDGGFTTGTVLTVDGGGRLKVA